MILLKCASCYKVLGLGIRRIESDRKPIQPILIEELKDGDVLDTKEFYNGHFEKENALDKFLVHYIYSRLRKTGR